MDAATQVPDRVQAVVERVLAEPTLWPALIDLDDEEVFVDALVRNAAAWGLPLEADDVRTRLRDRRREWFERWI